MIQNLFPNRKSPVNLCNQRIFIKESINITPKELAADKKEIIDKFLDSSSEDEEMIQV